MFKSKIFYFTLLVGNLLLPLSANATDKTILDLEGKGNPTAVKLPFKYYQKQQDDNLSLIHQGGYKIYDIKNSQNQVSVIGPLRPCIGIVVTDGEKVVTFHKHSTNSLDSMATIITNNLNLENKDNLDARIFSTKDDIEWTNNLRSIMHGGKSHTLAVKDIKDHLDAKIGIKRERILAELYSLRDRNQKLINEDNTLGMYELAETCVALRLNDIFDTVGGLRRIKFTSIDPYTENVFGYNGTNITIDELVKAPTSVERKNTPSFLKTVPYDLIPKLCYQQRKCEDGYKIQRGICQRRMNQEEVELYFNYFGDSSQKVIDANPHGGTLNFFPLQ